MVKAHERPVAWWGKLPARGDFIGRGFPTRWRRDWDDWLQRGLALAGDTIDAQTLRERARTFAAWRYVAMAAPRDTWCGIFVPSHDRVGRAWPLTLAQRITMTESPRECAARLARLLDAAAEGPEALEAAIAALPPRIAHAVESAQPWPPAPCSLWWPLHAADDAPARTAAWPPKPALLLELLDPQDSLNRPREGGNPLGEGEAHRPATSSLNPPGEFP